MIPLRIVITGMLGLLTITFIDRGITYALSGAPLWLAMLNIVATLIPAFMMTFTALMLWTKHRRLAPPPRDRE